MTDRELLERAAKACELPECGWMGPAFMYVKDNTFTDWNPLTDDGDAFRLAVKLRLDVSFNDEAMCVYAHESMEPFTRTPDPAEATRRAIVLAAAAMAGDAP